MSSNWPENLGEAMNIKEKLLMGPGPSNCPPTVLKAAGKVFFYYK